MILFLSLIEGARLAHNLLTTFICVQDQGSGLWKLFF